MCARSHTSGVGWGADKADWLLLVGKRTMNSTRLRVYCGPANDAPNVETSEHNTSQRVTVPLAEVLTLLRDAVQSERTWLRDFEDDEITISMDLYEVLLAYQPYRRPSA